MTRLDVSGAGYADASGLLQGGNAWASHHYSLLTHALADTAAMAGDSSFADGWASEYDAAAVAVLDALRDAVSALGNLGRLSFASWENHSRAEQASTFGIERLVDLAAPLALGGDDWLEVPRHVPPSSLGGDPASLPGWAATILDHVEGFVWPDADLDRLRAAAATWRAAGQGLDDVATYPSRAIAELWNERSPEILPATGAIGRLSVAVGDLGDQCRDLAASCDGYADAVQDQRDAILDLVSDLVRDAVAIQVAGFALGFVTFGTANGGAVAINLAKIAAAAPRFARMLAALRAYAATAANALAGTRLAVAGIGAKVAPMSNARLLMTAEVGKVGSGAARARSSLKAHEGGALKGHTIKKHVGKSDDYLRRRLRTERKTEVSTFSDEAAAERSIGAVLDAKADHVDRFLRGGKQTTEFQAPVANPGRVLSSSGATTEGTGVKLVISRDPSMPEGYRIITAFVLP